MGAELDLDAAVLACAIEAPVGEPPAIETTRLSAAFDPLIQPGITVEVANGEIIFTARNERGQPLPGADANGRVSFPVARGRHVLLIEADGYPASEAVVVV